MDVDEKLAKKLHEELDKCIQAAFDNIEFEFPVVEDISLLRSIVEQYFDDYFSNDLYLGDLFGEYFSDFGYTFGEKVESDFIKRAKPLVKGFVNTLKLEYEEVVEVNKFLKLKAVK